MEFKRCKVVMLPTKQEAETIIGRHLNAGTLVYRKGEFSSRVLCSQFYDIYIVGYYGNVKEGDWILYYDEPMEVLKIDEDKQEIAWPGRTTRVVKTVDTKIADSMPVIIATTDKELLHICPSCQGTGIVEGGPCRTCSSGIVGRVPSPSNSFLRKYCELGGIDEVLVEMEEDDSHGVDPAYFGKDPFKLKLDKNNKVSIRPVKDNWNKEEVTNLLFNFGSYCLQNARLQDLGGGVRMERVKKWFEENELFV